ncbi:acetylcholine receptor subunit beta-like [Melopsittacus undulatus]|uniref:acetylcholine receptor subunit beta-like n=1 Tax=Melopsittacus undulatus TaxID=13146 RepID=UPI00146C22B4|nr:acetylcholine receptor subunit beta-like [Melopsittacus undulatus]
MATDGAFGLILLLLWQAPPCARPHTGSPAPPGQGLLRSLLSHYHRGVRPAALGGRPTVSVGLELAQLISLDEKNEELTTRVFLDLRWRDPRLQWDPRLHGGLRLLRIPAELLWLPDVGLDNNNDGEFGVSLEVRAVVSPDGSVHWRPPALFRSHCPIKVSHFPFDWQNCSLRFRSGSYGPGELRLRLGGDPGHGGGRVELPQSFQENGQWELWHRSGRLEVGAGLEAVTFALVLRRKPLFYLATVLVPCVLLTLLASAVFYLPPDAGEKLTLSLFALLTLTVFLLLLADKVPATSLALPLIARHLTATLLLLALGVALSVAVLNVHHRGPGTHRLPPALHLTATLLLLALGVALSVAVLNVHHRGPGTHRLPPALHRLLLQRLPPPPGPALSSGPAPPRGAPPPDVITRYFRFRFYRFRCYRFRCFRFRCFRYFRFWCYRFRCFRFYRFRCYRFRCSRYFWFWCFRFRCFRYFRFRFYRFRSFRFRCFRSGAAGVSGPGISGVSGTSGSAVSGTSGPAVSGSGSPLPPELREAAAAIGFIARSLREQRWQQELQELWHRAALTLDRLLLWAFLALVGACGLGTGLDAALHRPPAEPYP